MTLTRPATSHQRSSPRFLPLVACLVLALAATGASPTLAQDDDEEIEIDLDELESERLEEIRAEREVVESAEADVTRGIDGTLAEINELTLAMEVMDRAINEQVVTVETARTKLAIAERRLEESTVAVEAAETALRELEQQLKARAVESFLDQDVTSPDIVYTDNPGLTVRMEALLKAILQGEADIADAYNAVQNELAVERESARENRVASEGYRVEVERVQRQLEEDREIQAALFQASEERLEHLLYERQSLRELGLSLEAAESAEVDRLAAALQAARYSGPGGTAGPVATPDEIVWVRGIAIHETIAPNLEAMLAAAEADGIKLTGGGWRDPSAQIRLRRAHCGTSEFAVYEASASSCRPPTARPGSSYHERGLAVDFSHDGRSINSPNSQAFLWLKRNAADFGFYNLPSERWHWSTTGK